MEPHRLAESDDVREQGAPKERITVWKRSFIGAIYRTILKERMKDIASMIRLERTKDTAF